MKYNHTLCGKDITKDIDKLSTKKSVEILKKIKELIIKYKVSIVHDSVEYYIEDYDIIAQNLYIIHKIKREKFFFFDTMDDDDNFLLYNNSENSLLRSFFKISKIGYTNQLLNYISLLSIDESLI